MSCYASDMPVALYNLYMAPNRLQLIIIRLIVCICIWCIPCITNQAWFASSGKLGLQTLAFADAICDSTIAELFSICRCQRRPVGIRGKA